jgi:ATP-dependent Lhr-like helicase
MLGDDLDAWLAESSLMKRTFRICAVIAGLIERRHPGKTKSGAQVTISSDLIYDVLRSTTPPHPAGGGLGRRGHGLLDIRRSATSCGASRAASATALPHVTPLAVPVLLEIGQELVYGGGVAEHILREAADDLVREPCSGVGDARNDTRYALALARHASACVCG